MEQIKVLVVGCGNMGASHAAAYHKLDGFEIVGLVARGDSKHRVNKMLETAYPTFDDYDDALCQTAPDAVCIATYPDTHETYALKAFTAGAHVFYGKAIGG